MTHKERLEMAIKDLDNGSLPAMQIHKEHTEKNPDMYFAFEKEALRLAQMGYTRFSQWMVANHVRFQRHLNYTPTDGGMGEVFKIPNAVIGIWARRFIVRYPQYDVFRIKSLGE